MLIAVTGATGFLGHSLCEALLKEGHSLRAVIRSPKKAGRLEAMGVSIHQANLQDEAALAEAFVGVDVVLHNAAMTSWAGSVEEFRSVNIEGTAAVARAALQNKVARIVFISSVAVFRHRLNTVHGAQTPLYQDRRHWLNPTDYTSDWKYAWSKRRAEIALGKTLESSSTQFVILRPGPIYGVTDPKFTTRERQRAQSIVSLAPTVGVPMVHVDDVAQAAAAAATLPTEVVCSKAYTLTGPPITQYAFRKKLKKGLGSKGFVVPIPLPIFIDYDVRSSEEDLGFSARNLDDVIESLCAQA